MTSTESALASWHAAPTQAAIAAFVDRVTREGSPDFVPASERVSVFDNDGTLRPEAPVPFQAAFLLGELRRRGPAEPALADDPMVQAALRGDLATLLAGPHHAPTASRPTTPTRPRPGR
jgi:hypothetical protein